MKTALITGVTGQDGSYLAELLLSKGYTVHGIIRRASNFNTQRIDHLYCDHHQPDARFHLHYGDMLDAISLRRIFSLSQPDEVYNLAAQSHVRTSFDQPVYTAETIAIGTLNLLEAVRDYRDFSVSPHRGKPVGREVRLYQASSSEMFGNSPPPQSETTPFKPRSPYACAKVHAYFQTVNYREAYGLFAVNGILFNHESPRRGETFVTRKITRALTRIKLGLQETLYLGNLDAERDWGYAPEYVEAMWLMLQQDKPDDFVIATGDSWTVREFLEFANGLTGRFKGQPVLDIRGMDIKHDPRYERPSEVDVLRGDTSKAKRVLDWTAKVEMQELCEIMVKADLELAVRERMAMDAECAIEQDRRSGKWGPGDKYWTDEPAFLDRLAKRKVRIVRRRPSKQER